MRIKTKKRLKMFFSFLKYAILVGLFLFVTGLLYFYWRLEAKPMDLKFLLPQINATLYPDGTTRLEAEKIVLSASAERAGLFHIEAEGVELSSVLRDEKLSLPRVRVSYGIFHILTLNPLPKNVRIFDASLYLTLTKDNQILFMNSAEKFTPVFEKPEDMVVELPNEAVFVKEKSVVVRDIDKIVNKILSTKRFILENAHVVIFDEKANKKITLPEIDFSLKKRRFSRFDISAQTQVILDGDEPVDFALLGRYNKPSKHFAFTFDFEHLRLDRVGRAVELFKGFKVMLKGSASGEIDFMDVKKSWRNIAKNLSFNVETQGTGSVYLPQPLNITYPIQKITAEGVFGENLDELLIRPARVDLTTGLSGDVAITIRGIGEFFDTFDPNSIKTTIKARLQNVPIKEVPNVWPDYLGPTAHAWVKQNLSGGGLTSALFTLYFTGGEITNLKGDVDFKDVNVDYLSPMKPVQKASGKVYLYLDKVEIYASSGRVGNIDLKVGNVFLTELQNEDSFARIELDVLGPIPEVLALIDSEPLTLLDTLGVEAHSTKGMAAGQVTLDFPLVEDLNPQDVQVQVQAVSENAEVLLPIQDIRVQNGKFKLTVNNVGLSLTGNATARGVPLNLKWEEYFSATKKQPVQSVYEVKGNLSDEVLKPYFDDVSSYVDGSFPVTFLVQKNLNNEYQMNLEADLKMADVNLHLLSYEKMLNVPATLNLNMYVAQETLKSVDFNFESEPKTQIKGRFEPYAKGGFLLKIDKAQTPDNNVAGEMEYLPNDLFLLNLKGSNLNLARYKEFPPIKNALPSTYIEQKMTPLGKISVPEIRINVALDSLEVRPDLPFKQVTINVGRNGTAWQNLFVFAKGREAVSLNLTPKDGRLDGLSNDVGDFLNRLGVTDQFFKGKAEISAKLLENGGFRGELKLKDLKFKEPGFLMQAVTILGIWDAFSGGDLVFSDGKIPFDFSPNFTLFIKDGVVYGTTLGVTFSGKTSLSALDISGSVIPAYIINSFFGRIPLIGNLFKDAPGGGLVAVKYVLKGTPFNPSVSFNPLSSIAPGILGRFFK